MVSTIRIRILDKAITQFIHISSKQVFLSLRTGKVIMIHEVIPRVVRRININHLHFTEIRFLEQFQHFEVITLDIEILRSVPIHAILLHRTERLVDRAQHFGTRRLLAYPVELVGLRSIFYGIIAQQLAQGIEVHYTLQLSRLRVAGLREAGGGYLIECIEVELHPIGGCQIQTFNLLVHVLYSIFVFNSLFVLTSVTRFRMPKTKIPQADTLAGREITLRIISFIIVKHLDNMVKSF